MLVPIPNLTSRFDLYPFYFLATSLLKSFPDEHFLLSNQVKADRANEM